MEIILNKTRAIEEINNLLSVDNKKELDLKVSKIINIINRKQENGLLLLNISDGDDTIRLDKKVLISELNQIIESQTIQRAEYYVGRLKKGLEEIRTQRINDINLNRWKEYSNIKTDSLWIEGIRDSSGAHMAWYHGNFIPQIPRQAIWRYTKKGEWILDAFAGSGTTLIEAKRLERNALGLDISEKVVEEANKFIEKEENKFGVIAKEILMDSRSIIPDEIAKYNPTKKFHLLIMHPPYFDIIKFTGKKNDLSNAQSVEEFLKMFGNVLDSTYDLLDFGRYLVVVIGDKYSKGEWIPLGFKVMEEVLKRGYKLKSIVVKNFEETKGKRNQKDLWRYRALVGGFYIFKHEYILFFQKKSH